MRLIDAEALKKDFEERYKACDKWIEKAKDEEIKIRADATKHFICEVIMTIDNAPTVHHPNCDICEDKAKQYSLGFQDGYMTGKTRLQGEWWNMRDDDLKIADFKCSICKHWSDGDYNFCPNCGAKMKGGAEE